MDTKRKLGGTHWVGKIFHVRTYHTDGPSGSLDEIQAVDGRIRAACVGDKVEVGGDC